MNGGSHIKNNFKQKIANAEKAGLVQNKVQKRRTLPSVPAAEAPIRGKAVNYLLLNCIISSNFIFHIHDNPRVTHDSSRSRSALTNLPMVQSLQSMKDQRLGPKADQDHQPG